MLPMTELKSEAGFTLDCPSRIIKPNPGVVDESQLNIQSSKTRIYI